MNIFSYLLIKLFIFSSSFYFSLRSRILRIVWLIDSNLKRIWFSTSKLVLSKLLRFYEILSFSCLSYFRATFVEVAEVIFRDWLLFVMLWMLVSPMSFYFSVKFFLSYPKTCSYFIKISQSCKRLNELVNNFYLFSEALKF